MGYLLFSIKSSRLVEIPEDKVLDTLYFQETRLPSDKELKGKKITVGEIKDSISRIDNKIPLYDIYSKNMYLINRENVYNRVIYNHYRFVDKKTFDKFSGQRDKLGKKIKEMGKVEEADYQKHHKYVFMVREHNKLGLMIDYLLSFNLDILLTTYVHVFYFYANQVGRNITLCERESFMTEFKHINPYYSRSELINLALNMELIKPSKVVYEDDKLMELCETVKKNDISADTIMDHQMHIVNSDKVGIVQYYSLQGSFFLNRYLRGRRDNNVKDLYLEKAILSMWDLVDKAPVFDKSYILYRFIQSDDHISELEIGDIYTLPSFISTTRNPFYKSDIYQFGFILIKIKIPENKKGVGLCMETISHFPEEEEIILRPKSKLKLVKKDANVKYYHTDYDFGLNIKTKYEFMYQGKDPISFEGLDLQLDNEQKMPVDFLRISKDSGHEGLTVVERVKTFLYQYADKLFQFDTLIGNNKYTAVVERYDSSDVYRDFYAVSTTSGYSIYSINNDYITFFIEIGEEDDEPYMYVNYYFKYSFSNLKKEFSDTDFIKFISSIAHYFKINKVVLFADYESCDIASEMKSKDKSKTYFGGNYCVDFYKYLKKGVKRYHNIDPTELRAEFKYYYLDKLKKVTPQEVLDKKDRDEIYQIYKETFKKTVKDTENNLANFYVWMAEKHCYLIETLVDKMKRLFKHNNPFLQDYYIIDPNAYLYNNGLLHYYHRTEDPEETVKGKLKVKLKVPKNSYRLNRKVRA